MARYKVQGPDGKVHVFEGPDGATPAQVEAFAAQTFGGQQQAAPAAPAASAAPAIAPNPTESMSGGERFAAGLGKSANDLWLGLRSLGAQVADVVAPRQPTLSGLITGQPKTRTEEVAAEIAESRRLDKALMDTGAGMAGNIVGQIGTAVAPGGLVAGAGKLASAAGAARAGQALTAAGTAAMAPKTIKGAAAVGAGVGAMQPAMDWSERAANTGLGAAGSAGGMAALQGLSRVVRPKTDANALQLLAEGVTPTPGQILGGGFKRAEEALTSVPILGDAIKAGQTRAIGDLNRAAFNRVLAPIGDKLPKGLAGREAVDYAEQALGKRYDAILPKLTTEADGAFLSEVQNLRNMMGSGSIDPAKAAQFEAILQNQVLTKFQPGANGAPVITGQTMKAIESDLGQLAAKFRKSMDPDQQMLGDALREVQAALRGNVMRSNPQFAGELGKINEGWANFKRVQRAASGVGAEDGVFSAAQLQSAVKATDRSKDKGAFARGDALMQDLSDPAKAVLGSKVPDSGTPLRLMTGIAAGGGLGAISPAALGVGLGASSAYTRPGQAALAALLARRPDSAQPIASALERLAPYAAAPALGATTMQR